eukprot:UN03860
MNAQGIPSAVDIINNKMAQDVELNQLQQQLHFLTQQQQQQTTNILISNKNNSNTNNNNNNNNNNQPTQESLEAVLKVTDHFLLRHFRHVHLPHIKQQFFYFRPAPITSLSYAWDIDVPPIQHDVGGMYNVVQSIGGFAFFTFLIYLQNCKKNIGFYLSLTYTQ